MARTKQFDERQALVSAMLVFWEKGYEGTSIQDLEHAMGLNRTSIYQYDIPNDDLSPLVVVHV